MKRLRLSNSKRRRETGRFFAAILAVGAITLSLPPARADCNDEARKEIKDVNKEAMDAYQNMEFSSTKKLLSKAFKLAGERGCALDWIHAHTLMNLAILSVAGLNKKRMGRRFMTAALKIHPEAPLDKTLANPALKKLFARVRKKLRITEEPKPWPKLDGEEKPTVPRTGPGEKPPELPLDHTPIDEAPRGKPMKVTCRIKDDLHPDRVQIYFRPPRQSAYSRANMTKKLKTRWTWEGVIPGKSLWGSTLQYYILAKNQADKVIAASGSIINPHIMSITSAGGLPATENPLGNRRLKIKKKTTKSGPKRFWIQIGPSFGMGLAMGRVEVIDENGGIHVDTGVPYDKIETPGFAVGSLGGVLEFGYFFFRKLPKLLLSLQGRFGYIGMFTKNVPGAAFADFGGQIRARYFILKFAKDWLNLYAGGGLGFAIIRHAVSLKLRDGNYVDTDLSMGVMPTGFVGLTIGKNPTVKGYIEAGFLMTILNTSDLFTFHIDFSAGAAFSF